MLFIAVVIGVCMGSFGNVLIERLPAGESILGRSRCDGCRRSLSPVELVPLASWLFLRGTCRSCGARIPARVPLVEAWCGLLAAAAYLQADGDLLRAACFFLALWALALIAVVDLRTKTIPDALTFTVFVAGLASRWLADGTVPTYAPLLLAGFFLFQWVVSRGRWVGMGDVLLAAAIGVLVGTAHLALWTLLLAYGFGASVTIVLLLAKRLRRGDMVPFGPFLVIGAYVALFMGDMLAPVPTLF